MAHPVSEMGDDDEGRGEEMSKMMEGHGVYEEAAEWLSRQSAQYY
jgi:hypothetical protein